MTTEPKMPVLLPQINIRWEPDNLLPGTAYANDDALRSMCDFGAKQVASGKCDALAFDCMPNEVSFIHEYMASKHSNIAYGIGSGRRVLALAIDTARSKEGQHHD